MCNRNHSNHKVLTDKLSIYQEVYIKVEGGYLPDKIVAQSAKPLRLIFIRQEEVPYSEIVIFPDFQRSVVLPISKLVQVDFLLEHPGKYTFISQLGKYRGIIIVK